LGARKPNPNAAPGKSEPKLSQEAKEWVVCQWAAFRTAEQIRADLLEIWGIKISDEGVRYYSDRNPKRPKHWTELHEKAREAWRNSALEIPIANVTWRLAERKRLYDLTVSKAAPNLVFAIEQLNDAARDSGGLFSNRRDLTTAGEKIEPGGSVYVNPVVAAMDLDAAGEAQLREVLRKALEPVEEKTPKDGAVRGRRSPSKS